MIAQLTSGQPISDAQLKQTLVEALRSGVPPGKRVLVIVPDDTRTLPMPAISEAILDALLPQAKELGFLVALGTHPPLSPAALARHLGERAISTPQLKIHQHAWDDLQALAEVGKLTAQEMEELSRGLLEVEVPIEINKLALQYEFLIIVNPVFPHEVVGFSGGHKYFFPGISGPHMVNVSHWLGALITNPKINGHKNTPVREMIERAAEFVPTPRLGVALVMEGHSVRGLFVGEVQEAWSAAADLSSQVNIRWANHPYHTVISMAPEMYRELWTAGKCMYKLEPVVEDGGTLIIYAPHLKEVSPVHGKWLLEVGYHVRDYFLAQWERFKGYPWAVLAHSTHVKGIGTYRDGVEQPRIEVVLATGIPEEVCRKINLGYRDPRALNPEDYLGQEEKGVLVVPNAGEQLWRLADGTVPDIDKL